MYSIGVSVNWSLGWIDVSSVYVHAATCDSYVGVMVFHRSNVNWGVGGYMYNQYTCIVLYVTRIWCNIIPQLCCQLKFG